MRARRPRAGRLQRDARRISGPMDHIEAGHSGRGEEPRRRLSALRRLMFTLATISFRAVAMHPWIETKPFDKLSDCGAAAHAHLVNPEVLPRDAHAVATGCKVDVEQR